MGWGMLLWKGLSKRVFGLKINEGRNERELKGQGGNGEGVRRGERGLSGRNPSDVGGRKSPVPRLLGGNLAEKATTLPSFPGRRKESDEGTCRKKRLREKKTEETKYLLVPHKPNEVTIFRK